MDKDLLFLRDIPKENLKIFVETMLKKGAVTEMLTMSKEYKTYGKQYEKYLGVVEKEFLDFGSNTFWTKKTYKQIVCDVAKKLKVNFNEEQPTDLIEEKLLEKVLTDAWEKMSDADKKKIAEEAESRHSGINIMSGGSAAIIAVFRSGGFYSYQLTLVIVNALSRAIFGRGLSLAANFGLVRALGVLTGPVGIVLTALWTAIDIAGPAYRVTIPCVILLSCFRKELKLKKYRDTKLD